ncbi:hypothetical protein GQX74_005657 [Glossina fuscipes]|nr:hypothetical protein GQX74_005657 [Glossina fuscipes]
MLSGHYMIEAQLIMNSAPDDVPHCEELRTIIKDIFDIRESKGNFNADEFILKKLQLSPQEVYRHWTIPVFVEHKKKLVNDNVADKSEAFKEFAAQTSTLMIDEDSSKPSSKKKPAKSVSTSSDTEADNSNSTKIGIEAATKDITLDGATSLRAQL